MYKKNGDVVPSEKSFKIFESVKDQYKRKLEYSIHKYSNIFIDVVLRKTVRRTTQFSPTRTYGDLEALGFVSLLESTNVGMYEVKLPFIFFSILAEDGPPQVFRYWTLFGECKWWQEWETFNCVFAAFIESTLA